MNQVPEILLHESLDLLEQGESIEQILARYPEAAAQLRPFLETAVQLATLAPQPSLAAKQKSRKAFLAHAENLRVPPIQPSSWYRLRQILLPIASLAVVLILFATTAVSVSGSAIPGDALYSVKRLVETVRLNQADDPETAVALAEAYQQERIREVQTLLRNGRVAEVSFEGDLEAIQPDTWTVATVEVQIDEATVVTGQPQLGELALVNGRTANGKLTALTIDMLSGSAAEPEEVPSPSPTASSEPEATATLEPTAEPTTLPTATPTATSITVTPTPSPTKTPTPTPTVTATPSPTATLLPTQPPVNDNGDDGNDNDNNNDNDNDNDDDNDDDDDDDENDSGGSNNNSGNDNGGRNDNDDDDDND